MLMSKNSVSQTDLDIPAALAFESARNWLLHSGIQDPSGGVARYYSIDLQKNLPISSEITGYAASCFAYMHAISGEAADLDAAVRTARFLCRQGWDSAASVFPYEPGSELAYFFDTGIIVRGLLAVWRITQDQEFLTRAQEAALSLALDFLGDGVFHPVISLPDKQPLPYEHRWSRSPGCYQLKAALAWHDLAAETGDEHAGKLYESMLAYALRTHQSLLSVEPDRERLMDRLHAYAYFLEGLLPAAGRDAVRATLAEGLATAAALRRDIAPEFERSDVAAQLLRVRLIAHHLGAVPLDEAEAQDEASHATSFQAPADHPDHRLRRGFFFGSKCGVMLPFSNPVSTVFCMQALELWREHQAGCWSYHLHQLI